MARPAKKKAKAKTTKTKQPKTRRVKPPQSQAARSALVIKIVGNYPQIERWQTQLASLDDALDGGMTARSLVHVYGWSQSAKSSLVDYLSGRVQKKGVVTIAPFELLDQHYAESNLRTAGFSGELRFTDLVDAKGKPKSGEEMLDQMIEWLSEEEVTASIVDSVGAFIPLAEEEGSTGDAIWGIRAKRMASFCRKAVMAHRNKTLPTNTFMVNHLRVNMKGNTETPGGETIHFLSDVELKLARGKVYDSGAFTVQGRVDKLKFKRPMADRTRTKEFQFVVIPGYGVHLGLTALNDCVFFGLAREDTTIKMGGKSYGYLSRLLDRYQDDDLFEPFYESLQKRS